MIWGMSGQCLCYLLKVWTSIGDSFLWVIFKILTISLRSFIHEVMNTLMGIRGERLDGKHYNVEGKAGVSQGLLTGPCLVIPSPGHPQCWPDWGEWGPES